MTNFSLRTFSRFVTTNAVLCLTVVAVMTLAALLFARVKLTVEMDLSQLLSEDSEVARTTRRALVDFGTFDFMLAVIEAQGPDQEAELKTAAASLADALSDRRFIRRVNYRVEPESLEIGTPRGDARAIALLTDEDWVQLESKLTPDSIDKSMRRLRGLMNALPPAKREALLNDPLNFYQVLLDRVRLMTGPMKVNLSGNYFLSSDGRMLVMVLWPVKPASDLEFAPEFQKFLEETRTGIFLREPQWDPKTGEVGKRLDIHYYGAHYEAIADSNMVRRDFYFTSIVSATAVLCLFLFAFRRPEALFFVGLPLTVGMIWTLGLASLLVGRLTQVTMTFSAILIGQGIDFSVHIYNRYLEEVRGGKDNEESVRIALSEVGPATIAGALTTALGFFGMMATSFVGFRELGLVVGLGVLCCLVAVFFMLPPLLVLFGSGPVGTFMQRPMSPLGLRRFYYLASSYPRATVLGSLIVCGYLGFHAREATFVSDFSYLNQPSDEYVALRERVASHFSVPSSQVVAIVSGRTLEEALEENDRLFANITAAERANPQYKLNSKDSLRYYVPSAATQRRQLERLLQRDVEIIRRDVAAAATRNGISPAIFDKFLTRLSEFQDAARAATTSGQMPISLENLSEEDNFALRRIAQRYAYKAEDNQWRVATQIYPPDSALWANAVPTAFRESLQSGLLSPVEITGITVIQEELRRLIVRDLAAMVLMVTLAIFGYLSVYFSSLGRAGLALLPVLMALLCMLGSVHLFNMHLHYINIICMPMIIGIGVDSAIHLIHRYYENNARDLRRAVTHTGRAVVITSMTTLVGFGTLALANFRGIRELGIFTLIGVGFTLLATILTLPAILKLSEKNIPYEGGSGDDIG